MEAWESGMNKMLGFAIAACLGSSLGLGAPAVQARGLAAHGMRAAPLFGTWALDVTRLPMPSEMRPKSVTIAFADAGRDQVSTVVDITAPDGSVRHMTGLYQRSGVPSKIGGDQMEADTAAVSMPSGHVMVLALAKDGHPASTRVYTVAPDGGRMTESAVTYDDNGAPHIRTNYFTRTGTQPR